MTKTFIKSTFRSIRKNPVFSIINIMGLAIGIAFGLLIFVFVRYELSFDRYNEKADRIYRVAQKILIRNSLINQTYCPAPLPAALYKEYPEVETVTRIFNIGRQTVIIDDKIFIESRIQSVDSTFFDIFTLPFTEGNPKEALRKPNTVVITASMAKKYFGNEDPLNKILKMKNGESEINLQITGIITDVPDNSHFHTDFFVSMLTFDGYYNNTDFTNNNFLVYFVLQKGFNYKDLEAKMPSFVDKYIFEGSYKEFASTDNSYWKIYFQPLASIHLESAITGEFEPNGKKDYICIFIFAAVFILLIACLNYINLSTAYSLTRIRNVGVRKVAGASRFSLVYQYLSESLVIVLMALIIGMFITILLLVPFGNLMDRHLEIHFFDNLFTIPSLFAFGLVLGTASGFYPAFYLSSFKPVDVLKGNLPGEVKRPWLRNVLVVFQFAISIVLITSTIIVYKQLIFVQNNNLGFNKEQVIVIKNPNSLNGKVQAFKEELSKFQGIEKVSASTSVPGKQLFNWGCNAEGDLSFTLNFCCCDPDYIDVLKLDMVKGRFFSKEFLSDTTAIIINESAASQLDWKEPIGKLIRNNSSNPVNFKVIGVVKDYHYESMHQKVRPMALAYLHGAVEEEESFILVRVKPDNIAATIKHIDETWKRFAGNIPLEYTFFRDDYDQLYKNEKQTRQLFIVFSILAVFIACIGLFGLSSYVAEQRAKEISIRKVMGASTMKITTSLTLNFVKWVVISNLIALPFTWYLMTKWLEGFAYKISIGWWMFGFAALLSIITAIMTNSYQSIRAATRNPIESLKK